MKVLGIDPGIERLGWALVESGQKKFRYIDSGTKKTLKSEPIEKRLLDINNFLEGLIKKEKPDVLSIEKVFFSKNVKTALIIGEVRGVALMLSSKYNLKLLEFGPAEIKLAIAGYGGADKKSVHNMLKLTVSLPDKKFLDDETDAIAIACCGVIHSGALQMR
ncbi:crossover junction endodeoxyribonuclease RuvC [Candidatus Giovannonibacteria bacterium RIFCSPHIGHO2_12_44_12]|uniref:Crossover junction endodeoxyribonuclease RuvC n=3 Tax=Candidatus Giovannoniibacteriota TaxID=1752738 RepID=A0A1F5WYY4_9BACT|nr:MAG: crossover junction endodeoxyribonuclease RuvC [Candidatus Giovannonibacteria bacterium RIFCSPHIGHO2_02_43_16]OGF80850.1 MAG: crossover junction endodeoxyribonuclease RuvC [Candidatus Giovannonibacteria bacterium RIFCSPHIGHO2_12_44_12]OGF86244.1 MAG: crossover junction endodeoxyribonuclease RuvC [Candidatus Giovannonibacteria bacterium RIFCSPLOWO2_02_44_8]